MFERYTEKARRTIFFARYEASHHGSSQIESEHLLLGLLRENRTLASLGTVDFDHLRQQIEQQTPVQPVVGTSVDLPLSNECKRILAYAAEEAERFRHLHIGTEHLLLGMLREPNCKAAAILTREGVRLEAMRARVQSSPAQEDLPRSLAKVSVSLDLSAASRQVLEAALVAAKAADAKSIDPAHLLLGFIADKTSPAARMLERAGVTEERIRGELSGDGA
jgi:ATP-dependent Clp protease ATP-binding subunit ClpA